MPFVLVLSGFPLLASVALGVLTLLFIGSSVIGFSYLLWIRQPYPTLKPSSDRNSYPKVSIILPARNEEKRIRSALDSLAALDYPDYEVIIVDGSSEDATKEIASSYRNFLAIDEGELPDGWVGKVRGCWVGASQATGDILLFTDADVRHSKDSLRMCVDHLLSNGLDALTILTRQEAKSFWERNMFVIFFIIIAVSGGSRLANNPRSPSAIANGQYFMFRRDCYSGIDGHRSVQDSIVEDVALAHELKRRKKKFKVVEGTKIASTRMYPGGIRDIWAGWSKNLSRGGSLFGPLQRLVVVMLPFWGLMAPLMIGIGILGNQVGITVIGSVGYLLLVSVMIRFMRTLGEFPWYYAFIYPIGITLFLSALTNSYLRDRIGLGAVWKGRVYKKPEI